jgi:phytoene/squalene synthetase
MNKQDSYSQHMPDHRSLAAEITHSASTQTYYTVRFLVDHERVDDAYRAYAYFRWVDGTLDAGSGSESERSAFIQQQKSLLEACTRGLSPRVVTPEESMLVELIRQDGGKNSGLQSYIRNMMAVMDFDAGRRGRLISSDELSTYTRWLAVAVTEALHYFIGHDCYSPRNEMRYLAVSAAHITHMLRDTLDDLKAGYFNIPREYLDMHRIKPWDVQSEAYRKWVRNRVQLARTYFDAGREYLAKVASIRCRLAGFAYTARFETVLDMIEKDDFLLRAEYSERKSLRSGMSMGLSVLSMALNSAQQNRLPGILEFFKKDRSADFSPQSKAD